MGLISVSIQKIAINGAWMMPFTSPYQTSLHYSVSCHGVALHSGATVSLSIKPAPANHGIVFRRTDIAGEAAFVPARYDLVKETQLGTTLINEAGIKIMTVEHIMAALWGLGVDNALIEIGGAEVPIMDGSSEPFVFLIECAGIEVLDAPRRFIEVLRTVAVEEDGASAVIEPADHFALDITIQFAHSHIGSQRALYDFTQTSFKRALSRARTFGFAKDVEALRSIGLARGGSLENAIVLDDAGVLNAEGLRYEDEFVRHKALDCVGDYYLAGATLLGEVTTFRSGHRINNLLLREIFSNQANYRWITLAPQAMKARAEAALQKASVPSLALAV